MKVYSDEINYDDSAKVCINKDYNCVFYVNGLVQVIDSSTTATVLTTDDYTPNGNLRQDENYIFNNRFNPLYCTPSYDGCTTCVDTCTSCVSSCQTNCQQCVDGCNTACDGACFDCHDGCYSGCQTSCASTCYGYLSSNPNGCSLYVTCDDYCMLCNTSTYDCSNRCYDKVYKIV
jgi:hypothetical protein